MHFRDPKCKPPLPTQNLKQSFHKAIAKFMPQTTQRSLPNVSLISHVQDPTKVAPYLSKLFRAKLSYSAQKPIVDSLRLYNVDIGEPNTAHYWKSKRNRSGHLIFKLQKIVWNWRAVRVFYDVDNYFELDSQRIINKSKNKMDELWHATKTTTLNISKIIVVVNLVK